MAVREVLKMGDPRLLEAAQVVTDFNSPELAQLLLDMHDTMTALSGAGLAAPQIGVGLQVVIFGGGANPRIPGTDKQPSQASSVLSDKAVNWGLMSTVYGTASTSG